MFGTKIKQKFLFLASRRNKNGSVPFGGISIIYPQTGRTIFCSHFPCRKIKVRRVKTATKISNFPDFFHTANFDFPALAKLLLNLCSRRVFLPLTGCCAVLPLRTRKNTTFRCFSCSFFAFFCNVFHVLLRFFWSGPTWTNHQWVPFQTQNCKKEKSQKLKKLEFLQQKNGGQKSCWKTGTKRVA